MASSFPLSGTHERLQVDRDSCERIRGGENQAGCHDGFTSNSSATANTKNRKNMGQLLFSREFAGFRPARFV